MGFAPIVPDACINNSRNIQTTFPQSPLELHKRSYKNIILIVGQIFIHLKNTTVVFFNYPYKVLTITVYRMRYFVHIFAKLLNKLNDMQLF